MQEIRVSIKINAPKKIVWQVLTDLENYHLWNPFTPKVETDFKDGSDVMLHVDMKGNGKILKQKETMLWFKPEDSLAWGITKKFPVKTERAQVLTAIDRQTTEYMTYDKFWGPLVPLVMVLYNKKITKGFNAVARGLKTRAEELARK